MTAQSRPPILITRPQPQADRFARLLRRQGWTGPVHVSPLMAASSQPPDVPNRPFAAVIFSSETAALAAADYAGHLPPLAWCVGDRTATVARRLGFEAISAKGAADDLIIAILAHQPQGPLLYLHGRETQGGIAERLNSAGIEAVSVQVYAQDPCPLTPAALRLIRKPAPIILPILSPRTASLLVAAWHSAKAVAVPHVVALSPAVAKAAQPLNPRSLIIADHPDGNSLLRALKDRFALGAWG